MKVRKKRKLKKKEKGEKFGSVSLFKGISTFVGYLLPKLHS